jgi:aminopeptidase YwaD
MAIQNSSRLTDPKLWSDFESICSFGGRVTGTPSERDAFDFLRRQMAEATGVAPYEIPVPYLGWSVESASISLDGASFPCHALLRSAATANNGLSAEVIDLGRGTSEEFETHANEIAGRIVMVRHEAMFVAGTVHRRFKLANAMARGAVGFLVAGPLPGGLVAGGGGAQNGLDAIPAAGISPELAASLRRTSAGYPRVTLNIRSKTFDAMSSSLLFDLPGQTDEWIVLSAHVDGHDLAESAIDNATGLAGVLSIARRLAPRVSGFRRGIRVAFFSVEEWGLTGSTQYVEALEASARSAIALNVNLDSIAGSPSLAALISEYSGLESYLLGVAADAGQSLRIYRPFMANSDHAAFAAAGIPAIRLVAGFDDPNSNLRYVLTEADTRDKVSPAELGQATRLAEAIVESACMQTKEAASAWRMR